MPPRRGRPVTGKPAFFNIQQLERFAVGGFDAVVAQRLWRSLSALRDGGGDPTMKYGKEHKVLSTAAETAEGSRRISLAELPFLLVKLGPV